LDDRELVQKLLDKDPKAQSAFFLAHRDRLYKSCVHLLGYQDPEAEDIVQEAFISAFRQIPQFQFKSSLHHWLYRICMYLCWERVRKRSRQVALLNEQLEVLAGPAAEERENAEKQEADQRGMLKFVAAQRALLGEPCNRLLELRDVQGKSYSFISAAMKIPIGTVMSRLARCKEALKQLVLKALKGKKNG
jgi:RNA polymerase sigma-70 factor (ECF subfamily)